MKRTVLSVLVALPLAAQAQTYSKTETIEYHDNTTLWVLGQTAKVTCVAPAECTPSWAPSGIVMSETTYDTLARPVTVKSFGKLTQTLTYDTTSTVASGQLGTLKTVKDGNNNITTFGNWKRGIPQAITHADSSTQSAEVNDHGWIKWVMDENGHTTNYEYDVMGRLSRIQYPLNDTVAWLDTTSVFEPVAAAEYGIPAGHWRQTVSTGNARKVTYFDALWRPLLTHEYDSSNTTGTMRASSTEYDSDGRVTFQSYPSSDLVPAATGTWSFYDALGRVTQVKQDSELGQQLTTTTEYLPGFQTRVTNPRGQQTLTIYQAYDQPTFDYPAGIDHPEGASTEIHRNVFGNVTALRRRNATASEQVWRYYTYDISQQLCKTLEPETGATVYEYDPAGNLSWSAAGVANLGDVAACNRTEAWASGRVVSRTYDARNRLKSLLFPDSKGNQTWYYWPTGAVQTIVTDNDGPGQGTVTNHYSYNKRGLLTGESVTQAGWYTWNAGYGYDGNGALSTQVFPDGSTVYYAPNALGQPTRVHDHTNFVFASGAQYYPNGALKQFTYGNGIVHTMTQNARQLPARSTDSGGVLDNEYVYDANANVQYIYDWVNPNWHRYLYYDGLDRLTSAGSQMFGGDHWHRFTYNALDNLTSWKLAGVKDYATYAYDASNRLTSIQNTAGATIVGLSYDAQGNLKNRNGQNYDFDYGNRLREVTGKEYYRYDGHGRRVMAWEPVTGSILSQYTQDGKLFYQEDQRTGARLFNLYLGNNLVAIREVTTQLITKYQHTDALGSPVAVTNETGQVIKRNDYEPYGTVISQPSYGGIGFTGHVQDAATGLTYMQQRYYDPQVGRFLSVDPVTAYEKPVTNFCRYCYARNNPYRFTDPDGRDTVGEMIDQEASAAAQRGDNLATYGWAFTAAAWNILGAEGVSQITDKGLSGTGNGSKAGAAVELASVLPVVKAARAVATPVKSLIKADSFLVKAAESAGKSVQKSLDGLVSQLSKGNMNPGIGTKHLFSGIFEARARDGARVYFRQTEGGGIEVVAKSSKQNQEQVIGRLKDMYEK